MTVVAITGHRSEDCPSEQEVRQVARGYFGQTRPDVAITGMANGCDLWFADEARLLGIEIWCARPWRGHGPRKADQELYGDIIAAASRVVVVTDTANYPGPFVYHKRNEWMVDHADKVVAYWSGKQAGGTYACINYAHEQNKPIFNLYSGVPVAIG